MPVPSGFGHSFPASHIVQFALPATAYVPDAHRSCRLEFVLGQLYPASHAVHAVALPTAKAPSAHGAGSRFGVGHALPAGHRIQCVWLSPTLTDPGGHSSGASSGAGHRYPSGHLRHIVSRPTSVTLRRWSYGASVVLNASGTKSKPLYSPSTQSVGIFIPENGHFVPAPHTLHVLCRYSSWYSPGSQSVHDEAPADENSPGTHSVGVDVAAFGQ
jgi:hypothetical protein